MSVTLNQLIVLVSPAYAAIADLWRRVITESEQSVDGDDLKQLRGEMETLVTDEVREMEREFNSDIGRVMAMMDEMHDDADIVHDAIIDHNPCNPECPFCDHDKSDPRGEYADAR